MAYRELDDALGLTVIAGETLADRSRHQCRHDRPSCHEFPEELRERCLLKSPKSPFEADHAPPLAVIGIPRCRDDAQVLPKPAIAGIITSTRLSIGWMSGEMSFQTDSIMSFQASHAPPLSVIGVPRCPNDGLAFRNPANSTTIFSARWSTDGCLHIWARRRASRIQPRTDLDKATKTIAPD